MRIRLYHRYLQYKITTGSKNVDCFVVFLTLRKKKDTENRNTLGVLHAQSQINKL